jgi:retinol dehydrogenase-12
VPADLQGKVYIVTSANCGMGQKLARILYSKDSKVYLACSSEEKATNSITNIRKAVPKSSGQLVFLYLDLADLTKATGATQIQCNLAKRILNIRISSI